MPRRIGISGGEIRGKCPDWAPLADALLGWFMWMYEVDLADGRRVHAYKHQITRRYVFLTADGDAFEYREDDRYREIELDDAFIRVFDDWQPLPPE